jgi:hypothetical protein
MTKRYTARQAVENALNNALRYERAGFCRRCGTEHAMPVHLDSINLIAEEVYLWLGFGKEKHDLRLFGRIVKSLEDAPTTGRKEDDVASLSDRVLKAYMAG